MTYLSYYDLLWLKWKGNNNKHNPDHRESSNSKQPELSLDFWFLDQMGTWDFEIASEYLLGSNELIRAQKQGVQAQSTKNVIYANKTVQIEILSTKCSNEPSLDFKQYYD